MWRRLLVVCVVAVVGCKKSQSPSPAASDAGGPLVATFAGHSISVPQLQAYIDEQSAFVKSHYQDDKGKKAILEVMIETQLLADQAAKDGFDHDDEVVEQLRKGMVHAWRRAKFNEGDGQRSLPAADLHAYYDAHRAQYQRPERTRTRMIFFRAAPGHEAAVQAEAEEARRSLSQTKDDSAFGRLARTRSDDATSRNKDGDLEFRSHPELARSFGEPTAAAADSLQAPGELSPVVQGTGGFYLLQFEGRTPAEERSFEAVEPELRTKVWEERRGPLWREFIDKIVQQANIKIDDDALAKVNPVSPPPEVVPQPTKETPPPLEEQLRTPLPPFHETAADRAGPIVATFGDHRITAAELQKYFESLGPTVRATYQSEPAKRRLLEEMINTQVLVDEALKGGFQNNQLARQMYKRSMIDEWMNEKVFRPVEGQGSFSEADLRAYYEAHRADFHQPERVQVKMVFFKVDPGREGAVQAEVDQAVRSLSGTRDRNAFTRLAETRSDDAASRAKRGDLGAQTHDELAKSYGATVAAAADSLVLPGDVSRAVSGTDGIYLLQLVARSPAMDRSFEASQPALRAALWTEQKNKKLDRFLDGLMEQAQIKIDEDQLAKIVVNPAASLDGIPEATRPTAPFGAEKLNTPLAQFHEFPYTKANLATP